MARSEFEYIADLRRRLRLDTARVPIPPGDDMGAVALPTASLPASSLPTASLATSSLASANLASAEPVLVTTDLIAEGTDFLRPEHTPERIGWKALAVSLSDVAAMAAQPLAAVVAVLFPDDADDRLLDGLREGVLRAAAAYDCPLIGGDTNAWPGRLVVCSTVLAVPAGIAPVRRGGGRPGDAVCVTGSLGGSLLGRHLDFAPRVREARSLAAAVPLHAMMDLSDGLSSDLRHIAGESGVGAVIERERLPISADAVARAAQTGRPAWQHALDDGEDFELLFTLSPSDVPAAIAALAPTLPVTRIGSLTAEPGLWLSSDDGSRQPLTAGGYEHFRSRA